MSRYRKVEVRTWGDKKFRRLSPIPPCGQGLWLYLITGPHTNSIPGLFRAGRAALAEELGWSLEAFDKAFAEVFQEGMVKADWTNRVVWIPNSIKHNEPASPNVVKSWAAELDLIPECELKVEAVAGIAVALAAMNPAFSEAFALLEQPPKPSGKPYRKPLAKPLPKTMANQEQEQEQEQKENTLALTALAVPAVSMSDADVERVYAAYPRHVGRAKALEAIRKAVIRLGTGKDVSAMNSAKALAFLHDAVVRYARSPAGNAENFTPHAATWFNQARYFDDEREWQHGTNTRHTTENGTGGIASLDLGNRKANAANNALARAQARFIAEECADEQAGFDVPGQGRSDGRDTAGQLLEGTRRVS